MKTLLNTDLEVASSTTMAHYLCCFCTGLDFRHHIWV